MNEETRSERKPHTRILVFLWILFLWATFSGPRLVSFEYAFSGEGFVFPSTLLSVYAADLVFLALSILSLVYNKNTIGLNSKSILKYLFPFFLALFFSILLAHSLPLAFQGGLRILQGVLLSLLVFWTLSVLSLRSRKIIALALIANALLQSVVATGQVVRGSSLGLPLLGEQKIALSWPGVAKVDLHDGSKSLRGYGTMPHPNILGGFLACTLLLTGFVLLRTPLPRAYFLFGTLAVGIQLLGLLMTFSRSALLSFFLVGLMFLWKTKMAFLPQRRKIFLFSALAGVLLLSGIFFQQEIFSRVVPRSSDQFVNERILFLRQSFSVLHSYQWILGTGPSQYPIQLFLTVPEGTREKVKSWQFEYPHVVPMVILLELGIGGFLALVYFLRQQKIFSSSASATHPYMFALFLPLLLSDHYLWTTQQGRTLLWGAIGILLWSGLSRSTILKEARLASIPLERERGTAHRQKTVQ